MCDAEFELVDARQRMRSTHPQALKVFDDSLALRCFFSGSKASLADIRTAEEITNSCFTVHMVNLRCC